jgi:hypothetical protein
MVLAVIHKSIRIKHGSNEHIHLLVQHGKLEDIFAWLNPTEFRVIVFVLAFYEVLEEGKDVFEVARISLAPPSELALNIYEGMQLNCKLIGGGSFVYDFLDRLESWKAHLFCCFL